MNPETFEGLGLTQQGDFGDQTLMLAHLNPAHLPKHNTI